MMKVLSGRVWSGIAAITMLEMISNVESMDRENNLSPIKASDNLRHVLLDGGNDSIKSQNPEEKKVSFILPPPPETSRRAAIFYHKSYYWLDVALYSVQILIGIQDQELVRDMGEFRKKILDYKKENRDLLIEEILERFEEDNPQLISKIFEELNYYPKKALEILYEMNPLYFYQKNAVTNENGEFTKQGNSIGVKSILERRQKQRDYAFYLVNHFKNNQTDNLVDLDDF